MFRLWIVEVSATGHRMNYVRHLVREAACQGIQTHLVTRSSSLHHPSYQMMEEELHGRFETKLFPHVQAEAIFRTENDYRRQWGHYRLFADFYRALPPQDRPDAILVPYLNCCDKVAAILGSPFGKTPWGGILMRDTFHNQAMDILSPPRRSDSIKEMLFLRLLKQPSLRMLFTIDEFLPEYIRKRYPALADRLRWVGDPVQMQGEETREEARERLGIPQDAVLLLVYGVIDRRKGIETLFEAIRRPDFPANVHLLLAGAQAPMVKEMLASEGMRRLQDHGRLHERNCYLSDEEEFQVFRAADIVWTGYQGHYAMSAVLLQAGAMGLPVVATQEGLIGKLTERYRLGITIAPNDPNAAVEAIRTLANDLPLRFQYAANSRHLSEKHDASTFAQTIIGAMASPVR